MLIYRLLSIELEWWMRKVARRCQSYVLVGEVRHAHTVEYANEVEAHRRVGVFMVTLFTVDCLSWYIICTDLIFTNASMHLSHRKQSEAFNNLTMSYEGQSISFNNIRYVWDRDQSDRPNHVTKIASVGNFCELAVCNKYRGTVEPRKCHSSSRSRYHCGLD